MEKEKKPITLERKQISHVSKTRWIQCNWLKGYKHLERKSQVNLLHCFIFIWEFVAQIEEVAALRSRNLVTSKELSSKGNFHLSVK